MLNKDDIIKKTPFYILWGIYVFRFKKFPYYMHFPEFKNKMRNKQAIMLLFGIVVIDISYNVWNLIRLEEGKF